MVSRAAGGWLGVPPCTWAFMSASLGFLTPQRPQGVQCVVLKGTYCHFLCTQLVKTVTKDQPHFRWKGHRSSFLMGGTLKDLLTLRKTITVPDPLLSNQHSLSGWV